MSRRRPSPFTNPVLIGAVTILIVLVGVYLAYNANNGLPFVPTRELRVDFANGQELVKGDEVREGGQRIGLVTAMTPARLPSGRVVARATLHLDKSAGAFPVDSTATIRPKTALGLEYVALVRGGSRSVVADGGLLGVGRAQSQVELDQVLSTFDQPTRVASVTNLNEFGDAFAGRGGDLSTTVAGLPRTLGFLRAVAGNLADPSTRLSNLFTQLEVTNATLAPVSGTLAHLFATMADTFAAINRDPAALSATITQTPPTLAVGTRSLQVQRPFLVDLAGLGRDLSPALTALRGALPTVNAALRTGTRVTRRTPVLYQHLQGAVGALRDLALTPTTNAALRGLTATVATLQPQLRFLGPYVTVCNDWNYWWTFVGNSQTAPTPTGTSLRALLMLGNPTQPDDVGTQGANVPAHGGALPGTVLEHLHQPSYGAAIDSAGNADCENGQSGYLANAGGLPAKLQVVVGSHPPLGYRRGSTYATIAPSGQGQGRGPDHVPAGETFTRESGGLGAMVPDPEAGKVLPPAP